MGKRYGTQQERVLNYMRVYGSITAAQAINDIAVYRLAARISELKEQGYSIIKKTVKGTNKYGETVWFARYSLEKYKGDILEEFEKESKNKKTVGEWLTKRKKQIGAKK